VTPPVPLRPPVQERSPIYSQADSDVVPAKLLTPQKGGPTFRNVAPDINTMEIVISKQGRVEQVKLVTPPKRMTDMLMLSGAKTWKFSPALKDGQPVRYRTEFSWEMNP
jgi:outer membrane biosynthesis protein TonB